MSGGVSGGPFDEHEDEPQVPTFACPKCGHSLEVGTPICGNCGTILQGGTHVPEPLAASGVRPGVVIAAALVVALGLGVFFAREQIGDAFDAVGDAVESGTQGTDSADPKTIGGGGGNGGGDGGNGGKSGGNGGGGSNRPAGPRHVGQVVAEIRAAGIPCTGTRVDSSDEYVETGSCQSNGQHVQINLYFQPQTVAFAEDFYADFAFASVHRDNWWISGDTALMRRIHRALGGRFQPPS